MIPEWSSWRSESKTDGLFRHLQIKPVQKQTRAGQRTRFKAIVVIGDSEGHVGLGIKTSKEVATAIRAAIIIAKLSVLPIRRGYWGTSLGDPHSLPCKGSGKCGSVVVRVSRSPQLHPSHSFGRMRWMILLMHVDSSSRHLEELESSRRLPSNVFYSLLVSKIHTHSPADRPRHSRTR